VRLLALGVILFAVYLVGDDPPTSEELGFLGIAERLLEGEVLRSPMGLGFPLLIAPLEGLGDEVVSVVLAAVAALGFVLAAVLARRIVCWVKSGDALRRGDRFGLIMFGSRTDLYLPRGCKLEVGKGQKVKGGETIVGRFA